jgi:hypothetical protein
MSSPSLKSVKNPEKVMPMATPANSTALNADKGPGLSWKAPTAINVGNNKNASEENLKMHFNKLNKRNREKRTLSLIPNTGSVPRIEVDIPESTLAVGGRRKRKLRRTRNKKRHSAKRKTAKYRS